MMSEFARVDSVAALKDLRVALCAFADSANAAIAEADAEAERVKGWVQHDQSRYWKAQQRKRKEIVHRAKQALVRKRSDRSSAMHSSHADEEARALAKAQKLLEESEGKTVHVQRWSRKLEEAIFAYKSQMNSVAELMNADIPRALADLDRMIAALDAYTAAGPMRAATSEVSQSQPAGTAAASMAGGRGIDGADNAILIARLRAQSPDQTTRMNAPSAGTDDFEASGCQMFAQQQQDVARVVSDPDGVTADAYVVIDPRITDSSLYYLERLQPAEKKDTGWCAGLIDQADPQALVKVPLSCWLRADANWRIILNLPVGSMILVRNGVLESAWDAEDQPLFGQRGAG